MHFFELLLILILVPHFKFSAIEIQELTWNFIVIKLWMVHTNVSCFLPIIILVSCPALAPASPADDESVFSRSSVAAALLNDSRKVSFLRLFPAARRRRENRMLETDCSIRRVLLWNCLQTISLYYICRPPGAVHQTHVHTQAKPRDLFTVLLLCDRTDIPDVRWVVLTVTSAVETDVLSLYADVPL